MSSARATIVAIASPPGRGERGVLRLSGPRAAELVRASCTAPDPADANGATGTRGAAGAPLEPAQRGLSFARFDDGRGGQPAMVLWMPGPRSFTGEDVAELHLPGAPALLEVALERLYELGAEPAAPGEFTRRAFEHGRIDLTRAEGVLALVHARSEGERRWATRLLLGGLGTRMEALRERLDALRALCEASLDFDEGDTGHVPAAELLAELARLDEELAATLAEESARPPAAGEPRLVLAGPPNAGKSSLFNRLTGGRALVSELAGTTRDLVAGRWSVAGCDLRLLDTAGVDPRAAGIDAAAQLLAERERAAADLVLWVLDASAPPPAPPRERDAPALLVWNQTDRYDARAEPPAELRAAFPRHVAVSALTGAGLGELEAAVAERLGLSAADGSEGGAPRELGARHGAARETARLELAAAREVLESSFPLDLAAESLRAATAELDRITGRTSPEDLLDRIFARFCIGK